ncbi:MAG: O-antigen ligase family protein [Christensenellales bacterium]
MNTDIQQQTMMRKPSRISGLLLYGLSLLMICNSLTYQNSRISRIILFLTTVLLTICTAVMLFQRGSISREYVIAVVVIIIGAVNSIINGSGFGTIVNYANLILLLVYFSTFGISQRQKDVTQSLVIIAILTLLIIFSAQNPVSTYYESIFPSLNDNVLNPNTVGLLYFFLLVYSIILVNKMPFSIPLKYFVKIVLFAMIFYLSWPTGARTSVVATGLFFVADILNVIPSKRNPVVLQRLYVVGLVATLLFTLFYMFLHKITNGNFEILGKNLFTGREVVWQEAYDLLKDNWLIGYDNHYAFLNGRVLNVHNSMLGVWIVLGIIPLIYCIKCIGDGFLMIAKSSRSRTTMYALFAMLFIMIFETLLTDSDFYLYFVLLFLVSNKERGYDT